MRRIDQEAAARSQVQREREKVGAAQRRSAGEGEKTRGRRQTEVGTSGGRVAARRIFICYGHRMGSDFRVHSISFALSVRALRL
jgi:hypothetical protein